MNSVLVWDPFVRVFHWATAGMFIANFTVIDDESAAHLYIGYGLLALVLGRLMWGFVGTKYARFRAFWPGMNDVRRHVRGMFSGEVDRHLSHNPLGALMVCNLLAALVLISLTGLMLSDLGFADASWVEEAHEIIANYTMACVGLHVAGVLFESRRSGTNLIGAMVTGHKNVADNAP